MGLFQQPAGKKKTTLENAYGGDVAAFKGRLKSRSSEENLLWRGIFLLVARKQRPSEKRLSNQPIAWLDAFYKATTVPVRRPLAPLQLEL